MKVVVVVATTGRPVEVGQLLGHLAAQTRAPHRTILSVTGPQDVPESLPAEVLVVTGSKGLPAQRNRGMEHALGDSDVIAFFDDDYLPSRYAIEHIERFFQDNPAVAGANGILLADGINSEGVTLQAAEDLLRAYDAGQAFDGGIETRLPNGLYGCNMVFRTAAIADARFDEGLPLYGWQEDLDFSVQVRRRGELVKARAFAGVHRGVKGGRTSGVRLGYSQIANPVYLCRKGTMTWRFALRLMTRNLLANHLKILRPEPWVDRPGRLKGNWIALVHLVKNNISPAYILDI